MSKILKKVKCNFGHDTEEFRDGVGSSRNWDEYELGVKNVFALSATTDQKTVSISFIGGKEIINHNVFELEYENK